MQRYEKIRIGNALFLDRDGVINRRIDGDYVRCAADLELLPGAVEAIALLGNYYSHIFVVTNQGGIEKGLMSEEDLAVVHQKLTDAVAAADGRIDHIYHCASQRGSHDFRRKPNIGMALQARRDYADIDLKRSVMIGDAVTDMLFGRRCGMQTILVGEWGEVAVERAELVDYRFDSLAEAAKAIAKQETV